MERKRNNKENKRNNGRKEEAAVERKNKDMHELRSKGGGWMEE